MYLLLFLRYLEIYSLAYVAAFLASVCILKSQASVFDNSEIDLLSVLTLLKVDSASEIDSVNLDTVSSIDLL
jgi:hypothetical protein